MNGEIYIMKRNIEALLLICIILLMPLMTSANPQTTVYANQPSRYGVYCANMQKKNIVFIGNVYSFALSPDGKWIAGTYEGAHTDLYLFPIGASGKKFLRRYKIEGPASSPSIEWSKDSKVIIVQYDPNTVDDKDITITDLVPISPEGKITPTIRKRLIAQVNHFDDRTTPKPPLHLKGRLKGYEVMETVYSPDKTKVAVTAAKGYYGEKGYSGGIYICQKDGTLIQQVTRFIFNLNTDPEKYDWRTDGEDRELTWLPNGNGIIFHRTSHDDEGI